MKPLSSAAKTTMRRVLLFALAVPFTAFYPLSFFWQGDLFLLVAALSITLMLVNLAWYRWIWCVYLFVASIPLLNTVSRIYSLPAPGLNINLLFLAAFMTAWVLDRIWRRPYTDLSPHIYMLHTPADLLFAVLGVMLVLALPTGWLRFNNVVCPGFYDELVRQFANMPFLTLFDNYLCFTRAWYLFQIGVAFYLFASSIRHRHELRNVLWISAAAGALVGMYGLLFQIFRDRFFPETSASWVGINWYFRRVNATLNGPHAAGMYFASLSAICLALTIATASYARKLLLFATWLLALAGLWFTGTRSAAFALVIVVGVVGFMLWVVSVFRFARVRALSLVIIAVIVLLGPGSFLFPDSGPLSVIVRSEQYQRFMVNFEQLKLDKKAIDNWLAFRFYHWNTAGNVIAQHPLAGSGLGTFDKLYRRFKLDDDMYKTAYTHSFYLDIYAEMGVVALIAVAGLYCLVIVLSWKLFRAREVSWRWRVMALGLLVAFCTCFVANFVTSDMYYVPELQLWYVLLLALLIRNYQMYYEPKHLSLSAYWRGLTGRTLAWLRGSRRRFAVALAVLAACAVAWSCTVAAAGVAGYRFFNAARPYTLNDRILEYGIYYYENPDAHNNKFARTAREVYKPVCVSNQYLRLYLRAEHPDAAARPVQATIRLDSVVLGTVSLSNRMPAMVRFDLSPWKDVVARTNDYAAGIPAILNLSSGRTWNMFLSRRGTFNHELGVDLGAIEWGYY